MSIPQITVRFDAPTPHDTTKDIETKSYDTFSKLNPYATQLNAYADAVHTTVRSITVETAIDYRTEMRQIRDQAISAKDRAEEIAQGDQDIFLIGIFKLQVDEVLANYKQEKQLYFLSKGLTQ